MPLEDHFPTIDDRRYDDILDEVRTRIARYTPEWTPVWTDVNESDPGITLVQVFAWLSEMLLYRMGRVPELNELKFLQLLGIELNPAEPARVEVSFPVKTAHTQPYVFVPERSQVETEAPDGGLMVYESERALTALRAALASVQVYDGYSFTPVTSLNAEAIQGFLPFGPLPRPEAALFLGFSDPDDFPQVELNLTFFAMPESDRPAPYACELPTNPAFAPARLRWEYWSGKDWLPLDLLKDETRALTLSGHIYLKMPPPNTMQRGSLGVETASLYWIRARLESSQYENPPNLLAVRTNTVSVIQAETFRDEVLGGSSGRRDQVFRLANIPALAGSLSLEIDEGDGFHLWQQVDDFFGSSPNDHHYVLNRTTGEVRFGDGFNGHIPVANISNPSANVVARQYRSGGGQRGNVPARSIQNLAIDIEGIDNGKLYNLLPAGGGRDEETLRTARLRARRAIRSRNRAVTSEDFEFFAMQAANIRRARALPLFHPAFPGVKVPGVVTVIVIPESQSPNPLPSEGTLSAVCACLNQHRLLTSEVYVIPPTYQKVEVEAEVLINDNADPAQVTPAIEQSLLDYFHPLKGGDGQGWPFGGTIFYSLVYQRIFSVSGVRSIQKLVIRLDGEEAGYCQDVPIQEGALVYSTQHQVLARYAFEG